MSSEVLVLQVPSLWNKEDIAELQDAVEQTCGCDVLLMGKEIDTVSKGELTTMLENTVAALKDD